MKKMIAVLVMLALLAGTAACGKNDGEPAQTQPQPQSTTAAAETTENEPETEAEDTEPDAQEWPSNTEFDAASGTITISGVESFSMPGDYDVSEIKHIVIANDVLSADLDARDHTYTQLESIECAPDCEVSVSTSNISDTPFFRSSKSWSDGVLYVGSSVIAINEDAPAVCKLRGNISSIGWDVREHIATAAPQVERFEIAKENANYQTDADGILYEKSDDHLDISLFPPASSLETYDVPDSVMNLEIPAAKNLKTIHISAGASLGSVQHGIQTDAPLTSYRVDSGHPSLYAEQGVLFKKEAYEDDTQTKSTRTVLLDYPRNKSAKTYRIPDGTDEIEYGAFQDCSDLETLYVPASVKDLENTDGFFSVFVGCKKLTHVYVDKANENYSSTKDGLLLIPFEWQEMDGKVTKRTRMIYLPGRTDKHFIIPSAITDFEAYGNTYLETLDLGKDVRSFSVSVDACPKLKAFRAEGNQNGYYTKDGVLYLKTQNWEDPKKEDTYLIYYPAGKNDKKFTVPDGVTHLYGAIEWSSDSAFHNNPYIEEIILPDSVTFIGIGAFAGCTALKKVNLPDTLKNLGNGAFYGCAALKELTIPTSLEALGFYDGISSYALSGSSITDIEYKGTKAQWDALVNAAYGATLPAGVRVHCTDA